MKPIMLLLPLLYSASALPGSITGKVSSVLAHSDGGNGHGVFMFMVEGSKEGNPSCSTVADGNSWAMSLEKEFGRSMYALVLAAHAQGKSVFVEGRGHCNTWSNREEPHYIIIQ